ncbi:hypothetical protein FGK63_12890 [Ruegeria sediminis]|uniref:Right handed beta helix domain-containing protein n=1 Tax=Ruegeria sediminis TaxID=2583820 RepID=A0ABY2WX74_9RHOB|nr:right-handed parallel beta-helix repeat-containing protein [Ruegeria sediminis]TMV07006.1 hypothetical protein FGK63_12890 [Ruegeria sediminis]
MSKTITVTSAAELNQALSQATGGETILLAAGDYGTLNLKNIQYGSNVSIKSLDPNVPATISKMRLDGVSNITFEDVMFDYKFNGEATSHMAFEIKNSSKIAIKDSVFSGDIAQGVSSVDDGYGTGKGLVVRNSSDIVVSNNEFFDWWKALSVSGTIGVNVSGNNVHSIRSDGMFFDGNQTVLIEKNYIHDFKRSLGAGDHGDFIQFTKLLGTSSDITIRENVIDMGSGEYAQSIFMGNGKSDPNNPAMFYTNVVIENNLIYNAQTHGITVSGAKDLTISKNTLLAMDRGVTGGIAIPKINVAGGSQNVTIDHNVVSDVAGYTGQSDWNVTKNVHVQNTDPNAPGYYDNLFVYHATAAQDGYNQYGVVPGSVIDASNAGSDLVKLFPMSYDTWVGSSGISIPPSSGNIGSGGTTVPGTPATDPSAPDTGGSEATGGSTNPAPDTGDTSTSGPETGDTVVAGPAEETSGSTTPDIGKTEIAGPEVGSTDATSAPDNGQTTETPLGDFVLDLAELLNGNQGELRGDAAVLDTPTGPAIHFDGYGDSVRLGRLEQFEHSEQLTFTVEFTRNEADGSEQRVVWNKGHVGLTLEDDGLVAHVANNDARFTRGFKVDNIGLNDTDMHRITVMVDQNADRLQIVVDGAVVLEETNTDLDFVDAFGGRQRGWELGTTHSRHVDGQISEFSVDDDVAFLDTPYVQENSLLG